MAIINHDYKDLLFLEQTIIHNDGTPLYGEIDMYRRIVRDCEDSVYHWHFWHDLRLPIPVGGQWTIQIDFLLVCEIGAIIIEVKGGRISVSMGRYYLEKNGHIEYMKRTPFEQADDYKYALMNNKIFPKNIYVASACAFPHTDMTRTNNNDNADSSWKLWTAYDQGQDFSFADFCVDVIKESKKRSNYPHFYLDPANVEEGLSTLLFNYTDTSDSYTKATLNAILDWLKMDSLSTFNSLKRNKRIVIEGGPGTGKTTLAKAYIKKNCQVKGLYICWTKLLAGKIKRELQNNELENCEVVQYGTFLLSIQRKMGKNYFSLDDINNNRADLIEKILTDYRSSNIFEPYNYIVVDEAQDILDKGLVNLLDKLSILDNGLETGSYMVFYDQEQGYNNRCRTIEKFAQLASKYSAVFILDENKRVPPTKEITNYTVKLINGEKAIDVIDQIESANIPYMEVLHFEGLNKLIKKIGSLYAEICDNDISADEYVILCHSSVQKVDIGVPAYARISALKTCVNELTEGNVGLPQNKIMLTTILKYKGLECPNVILVLDKRNYIDDYELYIGLSRAMQSVKLFILG